jgi:hypothetical protein
MTAALPAPLVPAEVDLRDFQFMPLDVVRLRDSGLASDEPPETCWAALLLWCAAWHQLPAGSIPDNDQWQAKQAGYVAGGRVHPAWRKVRAGALRNFVKCSDGRLYHSTIAATAIEAWTAKLAQRARTAAATAAREAKRLERIGQRDVPHDDQRNDPSPTQRNVVQGTGTGTGTVKGQGYLLPPDGGSGSAPRAAPPTPPPDFDGSNAQTLNGKAVVALSAAFDLPADWGLDAEALGFKPTEVNREAERFRQYWTAGKGKGARRSVKGWRQSWSNWLGKAGRDVR